MRHAADRWTYAAGHVALRRLLGARLGLAPQAVRFTRRPCAGCGGPHGRPEVAGGGDVRFSLSHSGDFALIAIATEPVGVDIERVPAAETADSVSEVLHPYEAAELAALPADLRPAAVTRAWTRKEAYLKGTGAGLSRSTTLDYLGTGPTPGRIRRTGPSGTCPFPTATRRRSPSPSPSRRLRTDQGRLGEGFT